LERELGTIPNDVRKVSLPSFIEQFIGKQFYIVPEVDRRMLIGGYPLARMYLMEIDLVRDCWLTQQAVRAGSAYDFTDMGTRQSFNNFNLSSDETRIDDYLCFCYPFHGRAWRLGSRQEVDRLMEKYQTELAMEKS
jgi:hypothetical protein